MISQDTLGWNFLERNWKHVRRWRIFLETSKQERGSNCQDKELPWKEFENARFESFCEKNGIKKEFSAPKTPQQNGVVERKNWVIQEMARVMLLNKQIPQKF